MNSPCKVCGRPTGDGAAFCSGCAHQLDAALADITAYRGLAYDLELAASRQTRLRAGVASIPAGGGEKPVPFDERASGVAEHLRGVLGSWARLICEETGVGAIPSFGPACRSCRHHSCCEIRTRGLPGETTTSIAAWLRPRVGWLRHHPAGAEAWGEILDAVGEARRVVDRPADRLYAGPCDCGEDLYARVDAVYVVCRSVGHETEVVWSVEERRRWLLRSAVDVQATALEISRALTRLARPVTPEMIRAYRARGRIRPCGVRREGGRDVALWRLGDVLAIVAPEGEKVSA